MPGVRAGCRLVPRREHMKRVLRRVHSRSGVDARAEGETDIVFGQIPLCKARGTEDMLESRSTGFLQDFQSEMRECSVFTGERHTVGNGCKPHHIKPPLFLSVRERKLSARPSAREQCLHELPRNARTAQPFERIRVVALGIENRVRIRKCKAYFMVVGDDEVDAMLLCARDGSDVGDATVDGDDDLCAALGERINGGAVEAVPLDMPMRNIIFKIGTADCSEKVVEEDASGNAVAVVVAEHDDALALEERV